MGEWDGGSVNGRGREWEGEGEWEGSGSRSEPQSHTQLKAKVYSCESCVLCVLCLSSSLSHCVDTNRVTSLRRTLN